MATNGSNTAALSVLFSFCLSMTFCTTEGLLLHSRNSSIYFRTPAYVWYHDPFEVTAPLVTLQASADCDTFERLQGRVLMTSRELIEEYCGFEKSRDPHEFARDHGSVGLIRISTLNPHLEDFSAWKLSPLSLDHSKHVPAVAASTSIAQELVALMRMSDGRPVNVTISSGDPNTAVEVFRAPFTIVLFSAAGLLSAVNTCFAILKVLSFDISLPFISLLILVPEILANLARLILSINTVFYVERALSWPIYRILFTISVPLGFTSTFAVSYRLYGAYNEAKSGSHERSRFWRILIVVFSICVALVVLFDITSSIFAAFYGELFDVFAISAFYVVVQLPLIYFFLVYGNHVSNILMVANRNVDRIACQRALKFVHRVRLSGIALIMNLGNMAAFATLGSISFTSWYLLFGCLLHTFGWVSFFQIAAVRPRMEFSLTRRLLHACSSNAGRVRKTLTTRSSTGQRNDCSYPVAEKKG